MAGLGIQLQKMLSRETFTDLIKAYGYSSFIVSGPILIVVVTLAIIKLFLAPRINYEDRAILMGLILYTYAFSLIGISPFVYVVTRYVSDRFFQNNTANLSPSFLSLLLVVFSSQTLIALPFLLSTPFTLVEKWQLLNLFLFVSGIWMAMVYLSSTRSYLWIPFSFVIGGAISILLSRKIALSGFDSFLTSFTLGQGITFFLLTWRIFQEFGFQSSLDFGFLREFRKNPTLAFVGIFYYSGIWIDKLIFWFSSRGEHLASWIHIYPDYDTPMFLAFLTIIPSMAFFLVNMETTFVRHYQGYYQTIQNRAPLRAIREKRTDMTNNLAGHFRKFVLFQGAISGLAISFIYQLGEIFFLNPLQLGILRIGILGHFFLMGLMMILIILFYFDFQREACFLTLLFCVSNAVLTRLTLTIGLPAHGYGFGTACFVSFFIGLILLDYRLRELDYWVFMRQPVIAS